MYSRPPLTFIGNKQKYRKILPPIFKNYTEDYIFIDLFGGSGYLSYIAKQTCKNNKVIYNDFDYYSQRIENIEHTQKLLDTIRKIFEESGVKTKQKADNETRDKIIKLLKEKEQRGEYIDWITISSKTCFTMQVCHNCSDLEKLALYNKTSDTPLTADNYLDGLDIVHEDWKTLYNQYKDNKYVVWLIDPPYPHTLKAQYKGDIPTADNLELLDILHNYDNVYYFTSSKSDLKEISEWKYGNDNIKITYTTNGSGFYNSYNDFMMYKTCYTI